MGAEVASGRVPLAPGGDRTAARTVAMLRCDTPVAAAMGATCAPAVRRARMSAATAAVIFDVPCGLIRCVTMPLMRPCRRDHAAMGTPAPSLPRTRRPPFPGMLCRPAPPQPRRAASPPGRRRPNRTTTARGWRARPATPTGPAGLRRPAPPAAATDPRPQSPEFRGPHRSRSPPGAAAFRIGRPGRCAGTGGVLRGASR